MKWAAKVRRNLQKLQIILIKIGGFKIKQYLCTCQKVNIYSFRLVVVPCWHGNVSKELYIH